VSSQTTIVEEIDLQSAHDGKITVAVIDKPYGEKSESIVSIGIFLQEDNDEPDWKVHLPKGNIDAVISALQKSKDYL
jgi:hypothetical protein